VEDQASTANKVKADAKDVASSVAADAKRAAEDVKTKLGSQVEDIKNKVVEQADSVVSDSRGQVASQVGGVAAAFKRTGEQLREEDHQNLAGYTEQLGEQVQGVADYLDKRDLRSMKRDIERFARRQPAAFVGLSLALGLVGARFLKSSRPEGGHTAGTSANDSTYRRPS